MPSNCLNSQDIALIDSLSESDLKSKLKDTIILLKEKERDLNIAAEIGQKLVEANNKLQKQQGSADDSASLMAMITNLKHQNLDLKSQLETSLAKNQKSKNQSNEQTNKSDHDQEETDSTILSLRKSNNQLQSEVLKLLKNLREREKTHNNTIQSFKSELQNLRKELDESSAYAQSLEQLKNKLIKEKLAAIKESKLMEVAGVSEEKKNSTTKRDASPKKNVSFSSQDSNTIQTIKTLESKLESQIEQNRALENTLQETLASNAQLESLKITQTELINNIQTQYDDLKNEISNESASFIEGLQKEIEDLQGLIGDLREELELERFKTQFDLNDSPPITGKTIDNETVSTAAEWQWTSWMDNNWGQIWEKNITTLRNEITALAENSTTTIESIRVQLDEIITPVKILGEKIGSIASGNEPPVSLLDEGRGRLVIANADVEE